MQAIQDNRQTRLKTKWQWRSNTDPWSKTEEPQWESYSPEHNYLIEKAHDEKKTEVDIGEYIVSIEHMKQTKKGNTTLQRPIRRVVYEADDEVEVRSERYFETEMPKTINKIFGSLGHFISFFSRRNPEMLDFTKKFEQFEQLNDLTGLNKEILAKLVDCIETELLKPIEEELQDQSISLTQKKIKQKSKERHEGLINLFKKEFGSFDEFYGAVLKSYTMNTGLYLSLNKHLRNENWSAIDNLLPYAVCLCKAFFSFKKSQQDTEEEKGSIFVYRGTALDDFSLSSYQNPEGSKLFSWNSVTSTSTNRELAEKFMYDSVDIKNKKYPVLFIIEIPISDNSTEYLKWIDIRQYSALPKEEEVILAPGSVFELERVEADEETKRTIVYLKLKHEVEYLSHGGLIMQGAFQEKMMDDKQVKIVGLEGEDLIEAFRNIAGNRLIEEIEFCLCVFDNRSLESMLSILPTLEKVSGLKFISCKCENFEEVAILKNDTKSCSVSRVEISEFSDFYKILNIVNGGDKYWISVRTVNLDFRKLKTKDYEFQEVQYLTQLTSLTLDFSSCEDMTDDGMNSLAANGLKFLTQLTSLTVNFARCKRLTDAGMHHLAVKGLKYLTKLISLTLNFSEWKHLTDDGVKMLANEGLGHLTQLTSLTLYFSMCKRITNRGVSNLASQALKFLTELTSLALYFEGCEEIRDEGVTNLASQGLEFLAKLTSLTFNFSKCGRITDKRVTKLVIQGLKHPVQLTSLDLNFSHQARMGGGVTDLAKELRHFSQLTSLALNFSHCWYIKNEQILNLGSQGVQYLTQLTSLTLDFSSCNRITDEGLKGLTAQGIKHLTQLTCLTLSFYFCEGITSEGLTSLVAQGYEYLPQLTFFCLNGKMINQGRSNQRNDSNEVLSFKKTPFLEFTRRQNFSQHTNSPIFEESKRLLNQLFFQLMNIEPAKDRSLVSKLEFSTHKKMCSELEITSIKSFVEIYHVSSLILDFNKFRWMAGEGITTIVSGGLRYFTQLSCLILGFKNCQITNQEVKTLANEGIKHLTQLNSLAFDFSLCERITDKGANNLACLGLSYLTQLTSLDLNFEYCQITDEGVKKLAFEGIKNLTKLTSITLNLSRCEQIADEGLMSLAQELKCLTQLISLDFDFSFCRQITGSMIALYLIKDLAQLTCLTLDFSGCEKMTNEGVLNLAKGLKSLTQLTFLDLDFSSCKQISDDGLNNLACQGLIHLTRLTSLSLRVRTFPITDEGLKKLAFDGIKHLIKLASLTLDFSQCRQITDNGVSSLISQGFQHLTHLALDFSFCKKITDKGVNNLACQGLKHMNQLTSLSLSFSWCEKVTNEGVIVLASEGLKHLTQLTSLALDFNYLNEITDEGVNILASQGLKYLSKLAFLELNFGGELEITDEGLNSIIYYVIKYPALTSLCVSFWRNNKITEFTTLNITRLLHYFGFEMVKEE